MLPVAVDNSCVVVVVPTVNVPAAEMLPEMVALLVTTRSPVFTALFVTFRLTVPLVSSDAFNVVNKEPMPENPCGA